MASAKDKTDTTGAPHEETWGMTEDAKRDWDAKHGNRIRKEKAKENEE